MTSRRWLKWMRSLLMALAAFLIGGAHLVVTVVPVMVDGSAPSEWISTVALPAERLLPEAPAVAPEAEKGPRDLAQVEQREIVQLDTGVTYTRLEPDTDYIVVFPDEPKLGATTIEGGRHILIDGGHILMRQGTTDLERRAIYIKDATGRVRIQNLVIEGVDHAAFDAFAISAPAAVVRLVNIRVDGVRGAFGGFHGDIVQPFGGVKRLVVNGLSGRSNYQGFYLQETRGPIGAVVLRNIDLAYQRNQQHDTTYLLWLDGCSPTYPVRLRNVYIEPRPEQRVVSHAVRPHEVRPRRCHSIAAGDTISWPDIPEIDGVVVEGRPPDGDFVRRPRCQPHPARPCDRPRRTAEARQPAPEAANAGADAGSPGVRGYTASDE